MASLEAFGATPEQLAESRAEFDRNRTEFEVWPENAGALEVFLALSSQWRVLIGAQAYWQGLRYETIPTVLRLLAVPRREWGEVFDGLRVMEAAAREVVNADRGR